MRSCREEQRMGRVVGMEEGGRNRFSKLLRWFLLEKILLLIIREGEEEDMRTI